MGKVKRRRSRHGKKKRVVERDTSSSSEESDSGSETSEEESARCKRKSRSKISKRPSISIIPDYAFLDVGNDDLYPGKETRFTDWDTSVLLNLEVQRDLGLSQDDKDLWDSALEKMISLRNIYNERRRTGREDLEVRNLLLRTATVHKSVQTLNEVEDVGTQVFVDVAETAVEGRNGIDLANFNSTTDQERTRSNLSSDNIFSSGKSFSNKDTSNKEVTEGNGGETTQDTSSVPIICQIIKIETWDPNRLQNVDNAPDCSTHTRRETAGDGLNGTKSNLDMLNSTGDQEGASCSSSSHPSSSGKSISILDNGSNENLENGCESFDCQGESDGGSDGVIVEEANEDNTECNDDGEKNSSFVTKPEKNKCGKKVVVRLTRVTTEAVQNDHTAKSMCLSSISEKVNPSSSQGPSTRLRKRKASEPSRSKEGHVKSKKPTIVEPNDDGEKSSSATQLEKNKRGQKDDDRSTRRQTARKSTCPRYTPEKVNSSPSQGPSTRLRKRKSPEPNTSKEGHVKSKKPLEPNRNDSCDSEKTNRLYDFIYKPKDTKHTCPLAPNQERPEDVPPSYYRKRWICQLCKHLSRDKKAIKMHVLTHTGEKPFECTECGSRFPSSSNLGRHLRAIHGDALFFCKYYALCGYFTKHKDGIPRHEKTCKKKKRYPPNRKGRHNM